MTDVTLILNGFGQGDSHAAEPLLLQVYDELRKLASVAEHILAQRARLRLAANRNDVRGLRRPARLFDFLSPPAAIADIFRRVCVQLRPVSRID